MGSLPGRDGEARVRPDLRCAKAPGHPGAGLASGVEREAEVEPDLGTDGVSHPHDAVAVGEQLRDTGGDKLRKDRGMATRIQVTIDCLDPNRLAEFWAE